MLCLSIAAAPLTPLCSLHGAVSGQKVDAGKVLSGDSPLNCRVLHPMMGYTQSLYVSLKGPARPRFPAYAWWSPCWEELGAGTLCSLPLLFCCNLYKFYKSTLQSCTSWRGQTQSAVWCPCMQRGRYSRAPPLVCSQMASIDAWTLNGVQLSKKETTTTANAEKNMTWNFMPLTASQKINERLFPTARDILIWVLSAAVMFYMRACAECFWRKKNLSGFFFFFFKSSVQLHN